MKNKEYKRKLLKQFIGVSGLTVTKFSLLIDVPISTLEQWVAGRSALSEDKFVLISEIMKKQKYYIPPHIIVSGDTKEPRDLFKQIRRSCSLSRKDLAEILKSQGFKINLNKVARLERGKTKIPVDIFNALKLIAKDHNVKII
jgi:DNA-binding transcriptional regulator YiaG